MILRTEQLSPYERERERETFKENYSYQRKKENYFKKYLYNFFHSVKYIYLLIIINIIREDFKNFLLLERENFLENQLRYLQMNKNSLPIPFTREREKEFQKELFIQ